MKKRLKTIAVIVCTAVCALTLPACAKSILLGKPRDLSKEFISENREELSFGDFVLKIDEFSSAFASSVYAVYDKTDNFAVSPISAFMALALASECAGGRTRTEILNALDFTHEQMLAYIPRLYKTLNTEYKDGFTVKHTLKLANSVWINEGTKVKQECIDALSDYYLSYSYSADFKNGNKDANDAVRRFVKKRTKGLVDVKFELPEQTIFTLINTLYLKTLWNNYGDELPFTDKKYVFKQSDGTAKDINLLQGYYFSGRVRSAETYSTFFTEPIGGYRIKFIVPRDGYNIGEVFTGQTVSNVNSLTDYGGVDEVNKIRYYTRCLFPEFKASFNGEIKEVLKTKFKINSLFDENDCDFSTLTDDYAYCNEVRHIADLTVNKKGIEGAAVTYIPGAGAAGPDEYTEVYEDFTVDKSFGFIITDYQNIALFSGVVNKV